MTIDLVPIADLTPDPGNARRHNARSLAAAKSSLRRFGQQKPIVIDSRGVVRAGNGTLAAARALGWTHIQAVTSDLSEADLKAYAIADNRTAELSEFDAVVLAGYLSDPDTGDVGFSEAEVAKRIAAAEPPTEKPPKAKPLKLTPDQYVTVRNAITAMREREGDPEISDGRAVELMAAEYLSGGD